MASIPVKLGYWNATGLAQSIRLLLAYLGQPVDETRYDGTVPGGAAKWFMEDKLKLDMDFPNLPYFIDNQVKLSESLVILYYFADMAGCKRLIGEGTEKYKILEIVHLCKDILSRAYQPYMESLAKGRENLEKNLLPKVDYLKKFLGTKEFFCGKITLADFAAINVVMLIKTNLPKIYNEQYETTFGPWLERFTNIQQIKNYMNSPKFIPWKPFGQITVGYWNIAGRGEWIRMLLEYLDIPYKNETYDIQKPEEWQATKNTLGLELPQLPYMFDGDMKLSESNAIMRYLGRKFGNQLNLEGKDDKEQAKVNMLMLFITDLTSIAYRTTEQDEEKKKESINNYLIPRIEYLANYLNDKELLFPDLTLADFLLYDSFNLFKYAIPEVFAPFENRFNKFKTHFENLDGLSGYLKSDRCYYNKEHWERHWRSN